MGGPLDPIRFPRLIREKYIRRFCVTSLLPRFKFYPRVEGRNHYTDN